MKKFHCLYIFIMNTIYISGYYGYKNFGDELLLLWVIEFLWWMKSLDVSSLVIEASDPDFLRSYLFLYQNCVSQWWHNDHSVYFRQNIYIERVWVDVCTKNDSLSNFYQKRDESKILISFIKRKRFVWRSFRFNNLFWSTFPDYVVIGWWESVTDSRSFPHNWRSSYMRFLPYFLSKKVIALWWVWSPTKELSRKFLYALYFAWCKHVYVRESFSYAVVSDYVDWDKVELYQDFSINILKEFLHTKETWWLLSNRIFSTGQDYGILNINKHIRSDSSVSLIKDYIYTHKEIWLRFFVPASSGIDDSDEEYWRLLQEMFPELHIVLRHRSDVDLYQTLDLIYSAKCAMIARLHLVLPCHIFNVQYTPLVYQPKITHMIAELNKTKK